MARRKSVSIKAILQRYGEKAAQAARQALRENAETLVTAAREIVPVEKGLYRGRQHKLKHPGRLRDSIHAEQEKKDTLQIIADAKDDKGYPYAAIVKYAPWGTPFMKPAYEAKKIEMINHTKDLVRAAIRS